MLAAIMAGLGSGASLATAADASSTAAYVALGDSYSSGEGAPPFDPQTDTRTDRCHRSANSYPGRYAAITTSLRLIFAACSGAKIDDVLSTEQYPGDTPGGQITAVPRDAGLVTLTIGGNDAGFSRVMHDCVLFGLLPRKCDDVDADEAALIDSLEPRLAALYSAIRSRAPRAAVYVLTYPQIFTNLQRRPICTDDLGTDTRERQWLRDRTSQLDSVVRRAAATAGVSALDEEGAFAGHELCTDDPWVNGEHPLIREERSFHPTAVGYAVEAAALARAVGATRGPARPDRRGQGMGG